MPKLSVNSSERQLQINRYQSVKMLATDFSLNKADFSFLSLSAFNRLSSANRWKEVDRVTRVFNTPR